MKQLIFSIYDEKAEAFYPPFFLQTTGMALREITDCVNDPQHKFGAHPADYTLFQIGVFDNKNGEITHLKKPLGCLIEYKTVTDNVTQLFPDNPEVTD